MMNLLHSVALGLQGQLSEGFKALTNTCNGVITKIFTCSVYLDAILSVCNLDKFPLLAANTIVIVDTTLGISLVPELHVFGTWMPGATSWPVNRVVNLYHTIAITWFKPKREICIS